MKWESRKQSLTAVKYGEPFGDPRFTCEREIIDQRWVDKDTSAKVDLTIDRMADGHWDASLAAGSLNDDGLYGSGATAVEAMSAVDKQCEAIALTLAPWLFDEREACCVLLELGTGESLLDALKRQRSELERLRLLEERVAHRAEMEEW